MDASATPSAYLPSGLQTSWDSTSLNHLMTCPRKYYFTNILGYRSKSESPHLTFGILYHGTCEAYDHSKAKGLGHDEALRHAVRWCLTQSAGWESDNKYKNRRTLVRTAVWYLEQFREDPARTIILGDGKPAVELSFRFEIDISTAEGEPYLFSGHIDRVAEFNDAPWILDRKTTKSALGDFYFTTYNPHHQLPLYNLAGKVVYQTPTKGIIVDAAQVLIEGSRFARAPISYSKAWMDEWYENPKYHIKLAEHYFHEEFWPANMTACHHYGGCPFRGICSKSPEVREIFLKADFTIDRWEPLKVRGDI